MKSLNEYRELTEEYLQQILPVSEEAGAGLAEAMRYSLLAGGKRIRPVLVLAFCDALGGDLRSVLPAACGLELIHTYSLIHDDLPCMDNDSLRRGKPTNPVVYGECTATLAGDCLQAEAFGTILRSALPAERRAKCAELLAGAAGLDGICGGQYLDMIGEGKTLSEEELNEINNRKTGALLNAACAMGVAAAGGSEEQLEAALCYGSCLGAAFQIRDDMLDVLSTEQELGKPIGSDAQEKKNTMMALYGEEKCREMIDRLTQYAKSALNGHFADTGFLCSLADSLAQRKS